LEAKKKLYFYKNKKIKRDIGKYAIDFYIEVV